MADGSTVTRTMNDVTTASNLVVSDNTVHIVEVSTEENMTEWEKNW